MATAKKAKGQVSIDGDPGTAVPRGTELVREDDVRFKTAKKGTVDAEGSAVLLVTALDGGEEGVTEAGSELVLVEGIEGLEQDEEGVQFVTVLEPGLLQELPEEEGEAADVEAGEPCLVNYATGGPKYLTGQRGSILSIDERTQVASVEVWRQNDKPIVLDGVRPRGDGPAFPGPTWEPMPGDPPK